MLNPDHSLDEIIRLRQRNRNQNMKRLHHGKFINLTGISTMEMRLNNWKRFSDARLKIQTNKRDFKDLRKKIFSKNTKKFDEKEESDQLEIPPYIGKNVYSQRSLDQETNAHIFTGLPSYHETKKIQITIKGLNKPKKKSSNSLFQKELYQSNFSRNSRTNQTNQVPSNLHRNISQHSFNTSNSYNSQYRELIPPRHASQIFSDGNNKDSIRGTKIVISNLSSSVTHRDITELCQAIGRIDSVYLHNSIAEVTFLNKSSALEAYKTYHNRHLDGKAMICKLGSNYNLNSHASVPSRMESFYHREPGMHLSLYSV